MARTRFFATLLTLLLLLSGCNMAALTSKLTNSYNEQLYINAELGFAIQHPLDWQQQQLPVASPDFREDVVRWKVKDLKQQDHDIGEMLIRSRPGNPKNDLPDLLSSFLSDYPELKSGKVENFEHAAGKGLKLLGFDDQRGRLTIALKAQRRDFIISLDYPSSRFDELLPVFQEIVDSFVEINPANSDG